VEPVSNDEVAALLRGLRRDSGAWHPNAQSGWSLAGAQPKLALAYDELTRGWAIPSGSRATTHILKPAIVGLDDHDLNEHLCLAAARALGLRAADSKVVRFGSEQALVVRRYDRPLIDGVVVRVHQEDFCQALGVHPQRKYQSDGGPTVDDLVGVLGSAGSQRDDIGHLLRAVAYNWLILCTDAHAKNYSLLLSGRQVRLAPLYDLASAPPTTTIRRRCAWRRRSVGSTDRRSSPVGTGSDWHPWPESTSTSSSTTSSRWRHDCRKRSRTPSPRVT